MVSDFRQKLRPIFASHALIVSLETALQVSLSRSLLSSLGSKLGFQRQGRMGVAPAWGRGPRFRAKAPSPCGSRPCGLQSLTQTLKGRFSSTPTGRPDRGLAAAAPPRDASFGAYAHPPTLSGAMRRESPIPAATDSWWTPWSGEPFSR